jgi:hypothetical protein
VQDQRRTERQDAPVEDVVRLRRVEDKPSGAGHHRVVHEGPRLDTVRLDVHLRATESHERHRDCHRVLRLEGAVVRRPRNDAAGGEDQLHLQRRGRLVVHEPRALDDDALASALDADVDDAVDSRWPERDGREAVRSSPDFGRWDFQLLVLWKSYVGGRGRLDRKILAWAHLFRSRCSPYSIRHTEDTLEYTQKGIKDTHKGINDTQKY